MKASSIAHGLEKAGLRVRSVVECTRDVDGMVEVTELVHVQVQTYGNGLNVVLQSASGEEFEFFESRNESDIDGIVADIRRAIGMAS